MNLINPQLFLLIGILIALFFPKVSSFHPLIKKNSTRLLQLSIILLGSSINLSTLLQDALLGLSISLIYIIAVFMIAIFLNKFFRIAKDFQSLLTTGTAICGGSAISAIAPLINAKASSFAISLSIVFTLNAIAIFTFPFIGEFFNLSQEEFGLWSALTIHDTSSVVATASIYGQEALAYATIIKLSRTLWLIPLCFYFIYHRQKEAIKSSSFNFPWFILGFIALSLVFSFIDQLAFLKSYFTLSSKFGFTLTMFLIGLSLNLKEVKKVGFKVLGFALSLWLIISILCLLIIKLR